VRKKAATADITIAMAATGTSLRELRDRAVLLLGFAGAFRRSELVALDVADTEDVPEGLLITIRRSKTDQEGQGRKVAIPRGEIACPVAALKAWLEAAGITEGAVFRRVFNKRNQRVSSARLGACNVAAIVKVAARKLGLDPIAFAGHSLRAGFVTSAVKRGANLLKITDVTGHRSLEMLKTYSRDAEGSGYSSRLHGGVPPLVRDAPGQHGKGSGVRAARTAAVTAEAWATHRVAGHG
jgi:site-specific recombinase XerD